MKRLNPLPVVILALLLVACLAAYFATRDFGKQPMRQTADPDQPAVDERLLATAQSVARLPDTYQEKDQARMALHLADQEVDQAFASALREAANYRPPASGPMRDLANRIAQLKSAVTAGQERVSQLTKQGPSDELDLAQAQLALDQDELDDSEQDLARQGGDPHASIERSLKEHETSLSHAQQTSGSSSRPTGTLMEQLSTWIALSNDSTQISAAAREALDHANVLSERHHNIEQQLSSNLPGGKAQGPGAARGLATLRHLSDQRRTLADLDKRIQDCRQLASVYNVWTTLVDGRRRAVLHLALSSLAQILAILLGVLLLNRALPHAFHQSDKKRLQQMGAIARVGVRIVGLGLILLVIFGHPTQISTIIGLTTAGLTLALKDFLVSFFGWFALMGKNGIRVGDWVEIEGVGGEVIEIGLLKTVLLELGNWTNTGHPTGRQVAFSNSFAIEGHYFNFSTSGQWLWDELQVTLPASADPYQIAQAIRELVENETRANAQQAEQDWERVTKQYGARTFSAKPAVDLRPSVSGLEVTVRYITHAPERNRVKSRLFELIVNLLHKPVAAAAGEAIARPT